MKKIIFLDVDGVLNIQHDGVYYTYQATGEFMEKHLVARLNYLIEKTGAEIVVSSSWRTMTDALKEDLKKAGFKHEDKILDITPDLHNQGFKRGDEILEWIDMYQNAKNETVHYIVLEDEEDLSYIPEEYIIQTDQREGFSIKDLEKAIEVLGEKNGN